MKKIFKVQVNKKHYFSGYDSVDRFISYFYQIDNIKKLKPKKILEIGIGNKTVSNYLKEHNFNVTTCDFDEKLKPDYVSDVRSLPFKDSSYDLVIAYEILEHLPWKDVPKALSELQRVTNKYLILSIPYSAFFFEFILNSSLVNKIFGKPFLSFSIRIPYFFKDIKFSGEHYWEIGRKGYSVGKFRSILSDKFIIKKQFLPSFVNHYFFILKKK